jgi:hypothetical protein
MAEPKLPIRLALSLIHFRYSHLQSYIQSNLNSEQTEFSEYAKQILNWCKLHSWSLGHTSKGIKL